MSSGTAWSHFNLTFFLSSISVHDSFDIRCSLRVARRQPIIESAGVCTAFLNSDHLTSILFVSFFQRCKPVMYFQLIPKSCVSNYQLGVCFSVCFNLLNFNRILATSKKWSLPQSAPLQTLAILQWWTPSTTGGDIIDFILCVMFRR